MISLSLPVRQRTLSPVAEETAAFPFFRLPPELREAILSHLVIFPYPPHYASQRIPVLRRNQHPNTTWVDSRGKLYPMNLLLTSKQMYLEAFTAWRLYNTFVWVVRTSKSGLVNIELRNGEDLAELMEIRRLVVRIVHLENMSHLEEQLFPIILSLVEKGNLRNLEFQLDVNFYAKDILDAFFPGYKPNKKRHLKGEWDVQHYVPTTAMSSLLKLLSHSLLKTATLRIDRCQPGYSASRWCPLHDYVADDDTILWGVSIRWRDFYAAISAGRNSSSEVSVAEIDRQ